MSFLFETSTGIALIMGFSWVLGFATNSVLNYLLRKGN